MEKQGVLCQEHCVEIFSRERSQSVGRTLHYSQSSPDYLEEKLLQATDGPVGTGWDIGSEGCGTRLSLLTCDSVQQGVSGGRKRKTLVRDTEGMASKTFPI